VCVDRRASEAVRPVLAGWTPLRATRQPAARSLDPKRALFVVTRAHERYYTDELADVRPWRVLVQAVILYSASTS
jgi:hypothetical protein